MGDTQFLSRLTDSFRWVGDRDDPEGADRTGWYRNPAVLAEVGRALGRLHPDSQPTVVVGPESSGYLLGALVAQAADSGFVGAQKSRGMLADSDTWITASTPPDYRDRNLELSFRKSLISTSDRVLAVDDWADTGGQLLGVRALIEKSGATYIGAAVIVDGLSDHSVRRALNLRSLLHLRQLRNS